MQKYFVEPVVKEFLGKNNKNAEEYKKLLNGLAHLQPDNFPNPSLKYRARNTITWPEGKEPFQVVIDARKILSD